jgi:aminocarboxymuconate-semialdehyde decarboxylase
MKTSRTSKRASKIGRRDFIKLGAAASAMTVAAIDARPSLAAQAPQSTPASAQPWNVPQRAMSQPFSVDTHCHWAPQQYLTALAEAGDKRVYDPLNYDMERRVKWMDQRGMQTLVLTLNGGMPWQWVKPEQGVRIAQICNDAAVQAHKAFPERFVAGVEVNAADPQLALKELNRVAGQPAFRAVHLPNSLAGREYLFEPAFGPFLARCEELGYPLIFHPLDEAVNYYGGNTRLADQFSESANFGNSLGFPFETATTAGKFIVSGTLDKFPKLEIVLPHSGGCFPYVAGRVDRAAGGRKVKLQHPFMVYVRRFHYDTLTYYPETLRFLVNLVGSDRVMIGTDNAFGATQALEYPHTLVDQLNLAQSDRDRILRGNAARLFRL